MSLVNTTIHTLDNQRIILPNTMIWSGVIKNVTAQRVRRVDMLFGISYSDDIPKTERILQGLQNTICLGYCAECSSRQPVMWFSLSAS